MTPSVDKGSGLLLWSVDLVNCITGVAQNSPDIIIQSEHMCLVNYMIYWLLNMKGKSRTDS